MTYWAHNHQCVSCEYWDGNRDPRRDARTVEAAPGSKGRCFGPGCPHHGKDVSCGAQACNGRYFQVWRYLQE